MDPPLQKPYVFRLSVRRVRSLNYMNDKKYATIISEVTIYSETLIYYYYYYYFSLFKLNSEQRLATSYMAMLYVYVVFHIPGLGEVSPVRHHVAAEESITGVILDAAVTVRNAKHVVNLEAVKRSARPRRPRVSRRTVVERIHIHLALVLQQ